MSAPAPRQRLDLEVLHGMLGCEDPDCRCQTASQGGLARAHCPLHDDPDPSLTLTPHPDGRLSILCDQGCDEFQIWSVIDESKCHGARSGCDDQGRARAPSSEPAVEENGGDFPWTIDDYRERNGHELLPQHHAQLVASAVSLEVAAERGYASAFQKVEVERLGFVPSQRLVPALVAPLHTTDGEIAFHQIRPDHPRSSHDGKAIKYETPKDARMRLDVHPRMRRFLGDPRRPLLITEGIKKADAATSLDLCTIALLGVANWRGRNEAGGVTALADWEQVALKDRRVYLAFDSDVMSKKQVNIQLARLRRFLANRGAEVLILYLPSGEGGAKVGLDDYLAQGHTRDELLRLADSELHRPEPSTDEAFEWQLDGGYFMTPWGIYKNSEQTDKPPWRIANFACRIKQRVIEDDGQEERQRYDLELHQQKTTVSHTVPA
ncbi:MAG: DUF3854 domain-containing protein, partial [Candidatus Dormibacteraceae bacterium]